MTARRVREEGPPRSGAARELIDSGFALENADAPFLHRGLNLADMGHVLDLARRGLVPDEARRAVLDLLLEADATPAEDFPYDPEMGEPYNSREAFFVSRIGDAAGWLHAGRPRREAVRIALRLHIRRQLVELIADTARFGLAAVARAEEHAETVMPDQTYLQHAQPSTFGHYVLSFVYSALRDGERLLEELAWVDASPGGAGCVNGTRLLTDREFIAGALGFDDVIEHTRDAMWQVDGLIAVLATSSSLLTTFCKLAEDLEIWSSSEFDYVDLDDGYTRASVLMPQKRNPYALSIIRGASGVLIGRLSGFLAVSKSPSARSDNLIYAYGEVPRALDLAVRIARLSTGVIRTLRVNTERLADQVRGGYTQATDLAEYLVQTCDVDYRTAYLIVGRTVRAASREGVPGVAITGEMIDRAAVEHRGSPLGVEGLDLSSVLDPWQIVLSRGARGGASPEALGRMTSSLRTRLTDLAAAAAARLARYDTAEDALLAAARTGAGRPSGPTHTTHPSGTSIADHGGAP